MNETDALEVIQELVSEGDAVYAMTRTKKRNIFVDFLDVVVSGGALTGAADIADTVVQSYYLVASPAKATIVQVRDSQIADTIDVPSWSAEKAKELQGQGVSLKTLNVAGYRYSRGVQIA
ncbi:MAG: hypothetical protein IPL43_14905 [Micropruina sp.]|nr:hypothetical protein [Micropruina sp.]